MIIMHILEYYIGMNGEHNYDGFLYMQFKFQEKNGFKKLKIFFMKTNGNVDVHSEYIFMYTVDAV